jgi:glycine cleavage system transcriptional repressor
MKRWFILSAIGSDRPGLVAELAQLIYDIAVGSKRLERDHGMTILLRSLEGEQRPSVPAPGTRLYRVEAMGEDRAGIVAGLCRVLADHGVNIAELATRSRPGPGGSPHYELTILVEVDENLDSRELRNALEAEGDRLVIDVALMPANRA